MWHLWKNCLLTNIYVDLTKVILYVCLWSWVLLSALASLCSELLSSAFGPCSLSWGSVADSLGSVVGGSGTGSGCRKIQTFQHHHFNKTKRKTEENFSVSRHPDRWFHTSIWVQPSSYYCWTQTDSALVTEITCCKVGMISSLMPHLAETQSTVSPVPARELSFHALLVLHLQLLVDLLILRSCRINSVTAGTPAASVLSSHGQIWVAGVEQRGCVNRTGHNRCG